MFRPRALLALSIIAFLRCQSASAQDIEQLSRSDAEAFFDRQAERYFLAKQSPRYARLRSTISSASFTEEIDSDSSEKRSRNYRGVINHYRGKEGIKFPVLVEQSPPKLPDAMIKEIAHQALELGQLYAANKLRGKDLGPCQGSSTEKSDISVEDKQLKKMTFLDMLFISADDLPEDPTAEFGADVIIQTYKKDPLNRAYQSAAAYGVECLPTRVIITGKRTIRHTGEAALRNYENNSNGKGAKR